MKICSKCGKEKDRSMFYDSSSGGKQSRCKQCMIAYQKSRPPKVMTEEEKRKKNEYMKNRYKSNPILREKEKGKALVRYYKRKIKELKSER